MSEKWLYFEELGCYYSFDGKSLRFCPPKSDKTPAINDAIKAKQVSEFAYSILKKHFPENAFTEINIKFAAGKPHDME